MPSAANKCVKAEKQISWLVGQKRPWSTLTAPKRRLLTLDDGGMMVSTCSNQGLGQPCQIVWRSPCFLLPSNAKLTARSTCLARRIVIYPYTTFISLALCRHFGLSSARLGSFPPVSVHTRQGDAKVLGARPNFWKSHCFARLAALHSLRGGLNTAPVAEQGICPPGPWGNEKQSDAEIHLASTELI